MNKRSVQCQFFDLAKLMGAPALPLAITRLAVVDQLLLVNNSSELAIYHERTHLYVAHSGVFSSVFGSSRTASSLLKGQRELCEL